MPASVNRFAPVVRGEGKGIVLPAANWVDMVSVTASAASYTLPTGTDPAGGGSQTVNPPPGVTVKATILRISVPAGSVSVYVNLQTTAAIAANTSGNGSICIPAGVMMLLAIPVGVSSISIIGSAAGPTVISIESWW